MVSLVVRKEPDAPPGVVKKVLDTVREQKSPDDKDSIFNLVVTEGPDGF